MTSHFPTVTLALVGPSYPGKKMMGEGKEKGRNSPHCKQSHLFSMCPEDWYTISLVRYSKAFRAYLLTSILYLSTNS